MGKLLQFDAYARWNVDPDAVERFAEALSEQEGKQGVVARAAAACGYSPRQASRLMRCLKEIVGEQAR